MAGIQKKGNVWVAFWADRATGKRVKRSTGVHVKPVKGKDAPGTTARQLEQLARAAAQGMEQTARGGSQLAVQRALEAVQAVAAGMGMETGMSYTVREWAERWLGTQREKKSYPLKKKAMSRFLELVPVSVADGALGAVTLAHVQDYVVAALDEVGAGTVERDLEEVGAMFNRAVSEGILRSNPARSAGVPQWARAEDVQQRRPFTPAEIAQILRDFPGEWPDMVLASLLLGGQRLGDVATLRYEQIDTEAGLVRLRTQKTRLGMTKPLIKPLAAMVERRRVAGKDLSPYIFPWAAARFAQAGGASSKLSLEFCALLRRHGILRAVDDAGLVRQYKRRHRISEVSFHSLRATAVSMLAMLGYDRAMVHYIVGHAPSTTEERHYLRLSPETEGAALQRLLQAIIGGEATQQLDKQEGALPVERDSEAGGARA